MYEKSNSIFRHLATYVSNKGASFGLMIQTYLLVSKVGSFGRIAQNLRRKCIKIDLTRYVKYIVKVLTVDPLGCACLALQHYFNVAL